MITINEAITEAQADEMAEREVNKKMDSIKAKAPINTVTISLDEYIRLYTSTENYCRLMALICNLVEPSSYKEMRLKDEDKIIDFISYNEMDVYLTMLQRVDELKAKEEERGEDV